MTRQAPHRLVLTIVSLVLLPAITARADEGHLHDDGIDDAQDLSIDPHAGHGHTHALHFSHPIVTDSPLPENEVRLVHSYANLAHGEGDQHQFTFIGQWSPVEWFSIEAIVPVTYLDPEEGSTAMRLDNIDLGFKFASFALAEHGVLLAGGVEVGLPTGNEERGIGSDHVVELEPFAAIGFRHGRLEWVGRLAVGIPLNQNGDREADAELEWSTSFLYQLNKRWDALVEFDGVNIFGEEEDGFDAVYVTPGVKWQPTDNPDFKVGFGVRLPLASDRESHFETILTVFLHF